MTEKHDDPMLMALAALEPHNDALDGQTFDVGPVTVGPTAYDQLLADLFTTALEGGIGYWSKCKIYHWCHPDGTEDRAGFQALILEMDDTEHVAQWPEHVINRAVMARGYRLAATEWRDKLNWSTAKPPLVVTADTEWDYDAGDADMILQLGLFNDVVYG